MSSTSHQESDREALRAQADREELAERIARALPEDGHVEPMAGVTLVRSSSTTEPLPSVFHPCFCVIAQGAKEVRLGERRYRYDPYHYLLLTADLPVVYQLVEASAERPYLDLIVTLDPALVSQVLVEAAGAAPRRHVERMALDVSPLGADLLDAVVRLVRLLDDPAGAPVLAPLVMRELVYRLLLGAQGDRLRHIAVLGGQTHRMARTLKRLHRDFARALPVEALAEEIGMGVSSFHRHFKAVTGMSPLQFQKHLRLQEARRLLLMGDLDAATAGYRVGYNDASQFSREYKRLFGEPPMHDLERLRAGTRGRVSDDPVRL